MMNKNSKAWLKLVEQSRGALSAGRKRLALSGFRKVVANWDECPADVLLDASKACLLSGELDEARAVLARVEIGELSDAWTLRYAAEWYGTGDYVKTANVLDEAYGKFSSSIFLVPLAEVRERLGDTDLALAALDAMKEESPRANLVRGLLTVRAGDPERAVTYFLEAEKRGGAAGDLLTASRAGLEAARCYEKLGDFPLAWQTMCAARRIQFQQPELVRQYDKDFQVTQERAFDDMEAYIQHGVDELLSPDDASPLLVSGHPRSGTSVVSVALSRELNRLQFDERSAFLQSLELAGADRVPVCRIKKKVMEGIRDDYNRRLAEADSGFTIGNPMIDKNPGSELYALRWLRVFPASRVVFVQRHPLDILISCLFTYLSPNPISLQYSTPERAAESILASLRIQKRLCEVFPEHFLAVSYEEYVATGQLPMDQLPSPSAQMGGEEAVLNSPNYFQASKTVHQNATLRHQKYLDFLPKLVVERLMGESDGLL